MFAMLDDDDDDETVFMNSVLELHLLLLYKQSMWQSGGTTICQACRQEKLRLKGVLCQQNFLISLCAETTC